METIRAQKRDVVLDVAEYIVRTRYEDLSSQDRDMTKKIILDTLGCLLAGSKRPPCDKLIPFLKDQNRDRIVLPLCDSQYKWRFSPCRYKIFVVMI